MKTRNRLVLALLAVLFVGALFAVLLKWRGFRATSTPSRFETAAARTVRDFAMPEAERHKATLAASASSALA